MPGSMYKYMIDVDMCKNISTCLFSFHIIKSLSHHQQATCSWCDKLMMLHVHTLFLKCISKMMGKYHFIDIVWTPLTFE